MKNRSHRCDINRPRSRHEHKYSGYKKCITVMFVCEAQFMKKLSNTEGELKKKRCL